MNWIRNTMGPRLMAGSVDQIVTLAIGAVAVLSALAYSGVAGALVTAAIVCGLRIVFALPERPDPRREDCMETAAG